MKIFIDPGHGGNDPGAIGIKGTYESNVVYGVATALERKLIENGFEAKVSRKEDETVALAERAALANSWGADLFISIHCNGFINSAASGSEVFSYPGNREAGKFAALLVDKICEKFGTKNRGAKTENFAVLRLSKMPAVLIETAFITNPAEEEMMLALGFSENMADVLLSAVKEQYKVDIAESHWGEKHLKNLEAKGYISTPDVWMDFENPPTKAMVLALIDKITEEK